MEFTLYTEFPAELEAEWNQLLDQSVSHVPFLRYEYLTTWWQTRGGGEWPNAALALVTAREDGHLVGAVPLFHAEHNGQPALLNVGAIEISDYLDLLARPEHLDAFLSGLLPFLRSAALPEWRAVHLFNLIDSSPTAAALQTAAAQAGWTAAEERLQHSPYIPLPGDWETYLAQIDKKQRHEIRRKMRRLEGSGTPWRWYVVVDPETLDAEIDAFLALMAQDPEKAAFLTPPMREHMRLTMRCAFAAGCLQLAFLEINAQKAAAYLSFDYLNRLWVYNSGLDRSFNEYSPGWVLLGYLLQWANENSRVEFDFMRGDEDYKYRFGAVDRFVLRVDLTP